MKKLSRDEMKKVKGGNPPGNGCPANACGGGGNGTCKTGLQGGKLACICSTDATYTCD